MPRSASELRNDHYELHDANLSVYTGVVEPGNGGSYTYTVWRIASGQWFAAFPDYHASSRIGSGINRPDYVQEKMRCSFPDAEAMADIINDCQRRWAVRNAQEVLS